MIPFRSRKTAITSVLKRLQDPGRCDSTGLSKLDKVMGGGLYAGKAYGLQARKKIGKTILLGTISYNLNILGTKHLWVTAEMNDQELEHRQLARALNKNSLAFMNGNIDADEINNYLKDAPDNVHYANASGISLTELEKLIDRAVDELNIQGVIVDYLQLIKGKSQNITEHLEYVAQSLASIVRQRQIWCIVAAQLNQENNTRGGEGMLLAFDMVFNLNRDKYKSDAWLEMTESRYTSYVNIGSKNKPGLKLEQNGPFFSQL